MSEPDEIICKPTKWFLWRALAMCLMFAVGAAWFFRDYKWGYPEKNVQIFHYLAFEKAGEEYTKRSQDGLTAAAWEEFAGEQRVYAPIDGVPEPAEVLPEGTDLDKAWPESLTDYETYASLQAEESNQVIPPGWTDYSNSGGRKWSEDPGHEVYQKGTIDQQLWIAILATLLFIGTLFFALRTMKRSMKADNEGYTPPGGSKIPYSSMKRLDARKWDTKGLAYITYDDKGKSGKARIDGMVYGQFKKEEGEPAQKLYDKILANFKGEFIELAREDDEPAEKPGEKNDSEG
ncbi:MAG: hypothetical protein Q7Q71_07700 [Verrucomicrobiota bacterium JB023]|nr:hypothetical protein [Verrucomicrobiota bacterium JB023]